MISRGRSRLAATPELLASIRWSQHGARLGQCVYQVARVAICNAFFASSLSPSATHTARPDDSTFRICPATLRSSPRPSQGTLRSSVSFNSRHSHRQL